MQRAKASASESLSQYEQSEQMPILSALILRTRSSQFCGNTKCSECNIIVFTVYYDKVKILLLCLIELCNIIDYYDVIRGAPTPQVPTPPAAF